MRIQPKKYINTKSRPSWSADGKKVAVELGGRAYVMDKDKTVLKQLGNEGKWSSSPTFDPDSDSVVYASFDKLNDEGDTGWAIYRTDLKSGDTDRLATRGYQPLYNPNGDEIVFMGIDENYDNQLNVMNEDGSERAAVVEPGTLQNEFQFDATGDRLLYQTYPDGEGTNPELRILERNWGKDNLITNGQDGEFWDRAPQWSPDNKRVLFERHGRNLEGKRIVDLYTVDLESGKETKLDLPAAKHFDPAWSPDGKRIAFTSDMDGGGWYDLYTANPDGSDLKHEVDAYGDQHAPAWSPDGETLAYITFDWNTPKEHRHKLNFLPTPPPAPPQEK